ncbi:MotA/TolQ/ExbB proton channel family protein [Novosphingobium sp. JCM 18896]|uniref:MotA/TolQ/ExbB proton channel family protein n=1 Tax=Novosphingobium sp. JCM 18896 TaxID=2989731 RepID=UPI0022230805|nr:MotA/TolQ/ExbB proton channel family protein [Novosphingobium sp. JCM 18896]MCW1428828.1 MotA/TolQ/ExbB proton channel family protein [Novosphingobium sp. JCM 18896]
MNLASLLDPVSASIVVGGTLLATVLRCGTGDFGAALAGIGRLGGKRFDASEARSELAIKVQQIQREGVLRVQPIHSGDREMDEATDRMIGTRSVAGLLEIHEANKQRRLLTDTRAVRTLAQAADLAPVFGLAATLFSLTQLPADGINKHAYMGAISMAVCATLYGLLLANLVLAPLARAVERVATEEESERQKIVDWLAKQVAGAMPARTRPQFVPEKLSA